MANRKKKYKGNKKEENKESFGAKAAQLKKKKEAEATEKHYQWFLKQLKK